MEMFDRYDYQIMLAESAGRFNDPETVRDHGVVARLDEAVGGEEVVDHFNDILNQLQSLEELGAVDPKLLKAAVSILESIFDDAFGEMEKTAMAVSSSMNDC